MNVLLRSVFIIIGLLTFGGAPESALAEDGRRLPRVLSVTDDRTPGDRLPLVLTRELAKDAVAPVAASVQWIDLRGRPIPAGARPSAGGIRLRGVTPGTYELPLVQGPATLVVVRAVLLASDGQVSDRVSPVRGVPPELEFGLKSDQIDETSRLVIATVPDALPTHASVISLNDEATYADSQRGIPLHAVACPGHLHYGNEGLACASTPKLRLVTDLAERRHPSIAGRALMGEVGGTVIFELEGDEVLRAPILGPRGLGAADAGRHRVKLRASVISTFKGGPPAVGGTLEESEAIIRDEVASASRMWGQCGVSLGSSRNVDVRVVDPPELSMITVGCGRGLPASGGTIRFSVGDREFSVRTHAGETAAEVAPRLAQALRKKNVQVTVYKNARVGDAALSSYDLVLKDGVGAAADLKIPASGLSDDPSLGVCHGHLDLADGLEHFNDLDAATGTSEERYLLRALSDDDPATIELIVVPLFSGIGRIGESFIHTPGGSLEAALILDRTGVRAGSRSFTLAHELGHILLDLPGHPDDFGVDTPSSLMDADAADSTIFGPRRLSLDDCRRALSQSGEAASVPLIVPWPLDRGAKKDDRAHGGGSHGGSSSGGSAN